MQYILSLCSATLVCVLKMKKRGELEPRLKERIIHTLLTGMNLYKDEKSVMHNGCLTLCYFRMPQDVVRIMHTCLY